MLKSLYKRFSTFIEMAALFVIGRGAVTTSVLLATAVFGLNPAMIAAVAIPIGAVFASINTQLWHSHGEKRILNSYRDEIGAQLGIPPEEVTVEHLFSVAHGNKKLGIPPNKVIDEALKKNDRKRINSWVSNVLSSVLAIGLATTFLGGAVGQEMLFGGLLEGSSNLTIAAVTSAIVGAFSMALNHSASYVGSNLFRVSKKHVITNDIIRDIEINISKGIETEPEQVFNVFVSANRELSADIEQKYGLEYDLLPPYLQRKVVIDYADIIPSSSLAEQINQGIIEPTELAYLVQGQRSGVPPRLTTDGTKKELSLVQQKEQEIGLEIGKRDGKIMQLYMRPALAYTIIAGERHNEESISKLKDVINKKIQQAKSALDKYINGESEQQDNQADKKTEHSGKSSQTDNAMDMMEKIPLATSYDMATDDKSEKRVQTTTTKSRISPENFISNRTADNIASKLGDRQNMSYRERIANETSGKTSPKKDEIATKDAGTKKQLEGNPDTIAKKIIRNKEEQENEKSLAAELSSDILPSFVGL